MTSYIQIPKCISKHFDLYHVLDDTDFIHACLYRVLDDFDFIHACFVAGVLCVPHIIITMVTIKSTTWVLVLNCC